MLLFFIKSNKMKRKGWGMGESGNMNKNISLIADPCEYCH